jgi:hypothetical protein
MGVCDAIDAASPADLHAQQERNCVARERECASMRPGLARAQG